MAGFVTVDRKTAYLMPPSVEDWLSDDHLARFIVEVIDGLDLTELTRQYTGRGSKAHHPAKPLPLRPCSSPKSSFLSVGQTPHGGFAVLDCHFW